MAIAAWRSVLDSAYVIYDYLFKIQRLLLSGNRFQDRKLAKLSVYRRFCTNRAFQGYQMMSCYYQVSLVVPGTVLAGPVTFASRR